jgi:fibronectin-binding autotransporter adhesin
LNSLTVTGTLTINAAAGLTMTVTGGIAVTGTFSVGATAITHTLNAGGNITNTGTINFRPAANRLCNVIFNKNGNQTVSGAGAYTFNLITLNMGATNANILDMQSAMTTTAGSLTITNGTYKHDNASNMTPWTADPAIPASGGFWLNGAATVTGPTGFNVSVTGLFHIRADTMTIGNAVTTQLILNNASTFQMDGGVLTVTGGLDSAATNSTGTFTMSAGSINLMTVGTGAVTSFMLGSGTTFNMSGGTITLVNGDNTTNDLELRSGTVNVTGETLQIGSGAITAANQFLITNGSGASFTVWNLTLAAGAARTTTLGSIVNVLNSLTIQANNTLDGGGFAINVGDATGNATPGIGNWANNGAYTTGTSTVSFVGPGAASLGGTVATTFQNMTMNKSAATNTVTINTSPTVNATLTFTLGQIVTGANAVIVATTGTIATPSASSYVVGNFQENYAAAANLSYFAGNDFPVGDATNYTPVNISAGTTTPAGSLTVSTTATEHPQVTTPIASTGIAAAYDIARYWTFNNLGLTVGTAITATFTFVAGDVDVGANTANFIVERYDGTNWNPTTLVAANPTSTQVSNITATGRRQCLCDRRSFGPGYPGARCL